MSVSLSFSENSLKDRIREYNFTPNSATPGGLNTSTQALLIALPMPIKPLAAFLNDSINKVLPSLVDISSASSLTDIPSLSASFCNARYKAISSSVNPACSNCLSERLENASAALLTPTVFLADMSLYLDNINEASFIPSDVSSIVKPNFLCDASTSSIVNLY